MHVDSNNLTYYFAKMNNILSWDDLRLALAIGNSGTLSGAARDLHVSHATVYRRLGQLESNLGVALFQRSRTGYTPTAAGDAIIATARQMQQQVQSVERQVMGRDLTPTGIVRITTTDSLFEGLLAPLLPAFKEAYPAISLEIALSNQVFSLTKREADIALRPANKPPESLVGRRVGVIEQAVYAAKAAEALAGEDNWQSQDWIGPDEQMRYRELTQWMEEQQLNGQCRYRLDTVLGMYQAARNGLGLAVLPCYLADRDEMLQKLSAPLPALAVDLWLLTHSDLRNTARIRAVMDFIISATNRQKSPLRAKDGR